MRDQRSFRILLSSLSLAGLVGATTSAAWLAAPRRGRPQRHARRARSRASRPATRTPPGRRWPSGRAAFRASVVVAGSGQPARRARVSLSGGNEVGGGRSTTTDDSGRFAFSALPEGRFNLSASKPGHITGTYGQRQPGRPGHADPARRRPASPGPTADHARRRDHGHRPRRADRGHSGHARARACGTSCRAASARCSRPEAARPTTAACTASTVSSPASTSSSRRRGTPIKASTQGRQAELQQLVQQSEVMARLEAVQAQALTERIAQLRASMPAASARRGRERLRARLLSRARPRRRARRR